MSDHVDLARHALALARRSNRAAGQSEVMPDECVACGGWLHHAQQGGYPAAVGRVCSEDCAADLRASVAAQEAQTHLRVRDLLCACEVCASRGLPPADDLAEYEAWRKAETERRGPQVPVVVLDAFCGAGGATRGYQLAGFRVTGVDIEPQPHYVGDAFHQGDAVEFIRSHGREYDVIHASPPCQAYARVTRWRGRAEDHADLVTATREALQATGRPWVIENVPEAPVRPDLLLCGSMFGLDIRRHRVFETSWRAVQLTAPCHHHSSLLPFAHKGERAYADAMGCTWMTNREAREAIPPAYTEYVGRLIVAAEAQRGAA